MERPSVLGIMSKDLGAVCAMGSGQRNQEKAMECISAADHARDPVERLRLLGIAQLFMKLAEHVAPSLFLRSRDQPIVPSDERTKDESGMFSSDDPAR